MHFHHNIINNYKLQIFILGFHPRIRPAPRQQPPLHARRMLKCMLQGWGYCRRLPVLELHAWPPSVLVPEFWLWCGLSSRYQHNKTRAEMSRGLIEIWKAAACRDIRPKIIIYYCQIVYNIIVIWAFVHCSHVDSEAGPSAGSRSSVETCAEHREECAYIHRRIAWDFSP